ncbi:hypothetical protein OWR29_03130 [Actinoplanes sp. Pm04-4]|uniref:Uncharacterized protein n=1 Tax=Paractinoplanes pyxinae TaxID=2997416 RepID=A0ABT4ATG1_9ACTN|nr:hypothetical protein [Actinoplanes pyxinae]MCY1136975.1 hypothetical protein [Actinoplanes pyxinae]
MTTFFGLRKVWLDPGPGIAMVQAHYTWSPRDVTPDWADAEQVVLAPQGGPLRTAVLEVPRLDPGFALHHFFFVVGADDRAASPVFTEDIVSAEVTYTDHAGADSPDSGSPGLLTSVGLVWSEVEPSVPNYTSTTMDGLPFETMGDTPGEGSLYEFVRAQPLPHVFRGRVWGVRGSRIRYAFHLVRSGRPDPADNSESWDDNDGAGWIIEL